MAQVWVLAISNSLVIIDFVAITAKIAVYVRLASIAIDV
jgi:hypothetical protein